MIEILFYYMIRAMMPIIMYCLVALGITFGLMYVWAQVGFIIPYLAGLCGLFASGRLAHCLITGQTRSLLPELIPQRRRGGGPSNDSLDPETRAKIAEMEARGGQDQGKSREQVYTEAMTELMSMIGLEETKKQIIDLINTIKIKMERHKTLGPESVGGDVVVGGLLLLGNPGTGKTVVARIVARLLFGLGVTSNPNLVECSGQDLKSGYVGQTAPKVTGICKAAMAGGSGTLFVDEIYTLGGSGGTTTGGADFNGEAVSQLLLEMENNRNRLVVIGAGYQTETLAFVENANPGLASRFQRRIQMPDYNPGDLKLIFEKFLKDMGGYRLDAMAEREAKLFFSQMVARKTARFANGREVRTFAERLIEVQAGRLTRMDQSERTADVLQTITAEDITAAAAATQK